MPCHAHEHASVSVVLAGELEEESDGRIVRALALTVFVKPAGVLHADRFGPAGARLLSLELALDDPLAAGLRYRTFEGGRAARLALAGARAPEAGERRAALEAICALAREPAAGGPPREGWLGDCANRWFDPSDPQARLEVLAARAGVDPAHFSRAVRKAFGATPTALRRGRRVAAAAARLAAEPAAALAEVAFACGFADQPHFCREFKRATGLTPGEYRRWLALRTSGPEA